jgi:hypothetical protein
LVDPDKGVVFDVDSMVEKYGKQHQGMRKDKMGVNI